MAKLPPIPTGFEDDWEDEDMDELVYQATQRRQLPRVAIHEELKAPVNEFEERRFVLVGEPVVTYTHSRQPRRSASFDTPGLLATCDTSASLDSPASTESPKCWTSFNLGYQAGLMFARSLMDQALNPNVIFSAPSPLLSSSTSFQCSASPPAKKPTVSKKRRRPDQEEVLKTKKSKAAKRNKYSEEDDETLLQLAKQIFRETPDITDSALYRRVHAECGLDHSFSSIESHMKRFIKPKLFDEEE